MTIGENAKADELSVWAPRAKRVELVVTNPGAKERRVAMTRRDDGFFVVPAADLPPPGADYAFALDGGQPLPDPRSPFQPHGVHGRSRRVDHSSFHWTDERFAARPLGEAILYELHPGTFSPEGTWDGAAARLDHLVSLGVTHVSLMPAAAYPGRHGWGYDGVALYAAHAPSGGPDGLKRFVDACHGRGLAVILDVVYNHLGPDGNYLGAYGPYFTSRYHTPWGAAPNLDDVDSDVMRRFLVDNALMWLRDYHIDGLRLDAVHAILDTSATHLLEQLAVEVDALGHASGRPRVLIAESDLNDPRLCRSRETGGYGLDAQWSDDFHHALHSVITGETTGYYADFGALGDIARSLSRGWVYDGRHSAFRRRVHGRPFEGHDGHRLLGYLQTHDQIGNRARGERIGHLAGDRLARVGAALVMTAPFVPMLFQGEEWGASAPFQYFTDHESPKLAEAVRRGRKNEFRAFGWKPEDVPDPQDEATFHRSKLDWSEIAREPHASTLAYFRALIAVRQGTPDLRDGRLDRTTVVCDERKRVLTLQRGTVTVCANFGAEEINLPRPAGVLALTSDPSIEAAGHSLTLPGQSVAIFR